MVDSALIQPPVRPHLAEVFGDLPLHSLLGVAVLVRAKESYDVYAEGFAVEGGAFPAEEVGLQKALR